MHVDGGPPPDGPRPDGPASTCSPTCSSSQMCCAMSCVGRQVAPGTNGRTDPSFSHCGGCGRVCDPNRASACSTALGSGTVQCVCGNGLQCTAPQTCTMVGTSFSCVNPDSDPRNCGGMGIMCNGEETCQAGMCRCGAGAACSAGTTCCAGACINTTADAMNCGGCGMVCAGSETCSAGACHCGAGPACTRAAGSALGQLCCSNTCVAQDDTNCGTCGQMCEGGGGPFAPMCIYGMDIFPPGGAPHVCCGFAGFCVPDLGGDGGFGLDGGLPDLPF